MNKHINNNSEKRPILHNKNHTNLLEQVSLKLYLEHSIIPQLWVDNHLILRAYSPGTVNHFSVSPTMLHKNINSLNVFNHKGLGKSIRGVLITERSVTKTFITNKNKSFLVYIQPCFSQHDEIISGTLISFSEQTSVSTYVNKKEHNSFLQSHLSKLFFLSDALTFSHHEKENILFKKHISDMKQIIKKIELHFFEKEDVS